MGGNIEIKSQINSGAIVTVRLARADLQTGE